MSIDFSKWRWWCIHNGTVYSQGEGVSHAKVYSHKLSDEEIGQLYENGKRWMGPEEDLSTG